MFPLISAIFSFFIQLIWGVYLLMKQKEKGEGAAILSVIWGLACTSYFYWIVKAGSKSSFFIPLFSLFLPGVVINWCMVIYYERSCQVEMLQEENKRLRQKLTQERPYFEMAYMDSLTGLKNRRAFDEEISRLEEGHIPFCYAAFDINALKLVNDTQGHAKGDELLKQAAWFLKKQEQDIFCAYRVGGDEFALLSSYKDEKHKQRVEKILKDIKKQRDLLFLQKPYYNFAIGYGWMEDYRDGHSVKKFLVQVDRMMYRDKSDIKHLF